MNMKCGAWCMVQNTDRYAVRFPSAKPVARTSIIGWTAKVGPWHEQAEAEARADKSGIFAGSFIEPQDWRRQR